MALGVTGHGSGAVGFPGRSFPWPGWRDRVSSANRPGFQHPLSVDSARRAGKPHQPAAPLGADGEGRGADSSDTAV